MNGTLKSILNRKSCRAYKPEQITKDYTPQFAISLGYKNMESKAADRRPNTVNYVE